MPTQAYYRKWEKVYDLLDKSPYTSDSALRLKVQQEMVSKLTADTIDFLHRWLTTPQKAENKEAEPMVNIRLLNTSLLTYEEIEKAISYAVERKAFTTLILQRTDPKDANSVYGLYGTNATLQGGQLVEKT